MGRLPRTIADGLVYHALNRGNNLGDVFVDDGDHEAFLEALGGLGAATRSGCSATA